MFCSSWVRARSGGRFAVACLALVASGLPRAVHADVTISTATTAPQYGDGGTFTVTPTGTISGTGNGIVAQTGNVITTLTVDGVVVTGTAASGVQNSAGSTVSAIGVSGAIQGGWAIRSDGSIGSINNTGLIQGTREFAILGTANSSVGELTNSGTIESVQAGRGGTVDIWVTGTVANLAGGVIRSAGRNNLYLNGATTLLTNAGTISTGGINSGHGIEVGYSANLTTAVNSGLVEGDSAMVIRPSSVLGTFTNSGTFRASTYGVWFGSNSGTVSNLAGGLIESAGYAGIWVGGDTGSRVASLDNAGTIRGDYNGITTSGVFGFTALTNSGTISSALGGGAAIEMYHTGTTATLSNSGVISSGAWYGIEAARGTITTLVNSGTVSGDVYGIFNDARNTINTLTNEAAGVIHGNDAGLYVSSTMTAPMVVTNAGLISGGTTAGVRIASTRLLKLTNTGTISFSGTGTGPAVFVASGAALGDPTGAGGAALVSTGSGALLGGTIVNAGTIHHGFTIENQNVTVSANGGAGTFTNGTLAVTNGNLTFTSGTSTVAAGVSANAGAGAVITDANATVRFIGLANRTANFQSIANSGVVEFQQDVAGSLAAPIHGTGSVVKTGTGTLVLSGSSDYTGATTVAAGALSLGSSGALGSGGNVVFTGGTLQFTAANSADYGARIKNSTAAIAIDTNGQSVTFAGGIDATNASGLTKSGAGTLVLGGVNAYTGMTTVAAGRLAVNGSIVGGATVQAGATLGGAGTIGGTIGGAGLVSPGNSPGILTAPAVDPSAGTDFMFEFSGTAPNYANASASVNDLLRLTGSTPFTSALTSANTKMLFLNFTKAALTVGTGTATSLTGGFFTDQATDFAAMLNNATWDNAGFIAYVLGDGNGTDNFLNGQGYYNWRNPAMFGWNQSLFLSTVPQTADFGGGNINGQVMLLSVAVPEPSTIAVALAGLACSGYSMWRRRKRTTG